MGRSRGGLTTKIHALVDADGLPIALKLTEGQAHDGRAAWDMLGSLAAGNILLADRAYDCDALLRTLAERGAGTLRRFGIGLTLAHAGQVSPMAIVSATSRTSTGAVAADLTSGGASRIIVNAHRVNRGHMPEFGFLLRAFSSFLVNLLCRFTRAREAPPEPQLLPASSAVADSFLANSGSRRTLEPALVGAPVELSYGASPTRWPQPQHGKGKGPPSRGPVLRRPGPSPIPIG